MLDIDKLDKKFDEIMKELESKEYTIDLRLGDCLEIMKEIPNKSYRCNYL